VFLPFGLTQLKAEEGAETIEASEQKSYKIGDPELDLLWIDEKNGNFLPLDTVFKDENGEVVTLRTIIDRPTLILPIYFFCPSSCSFNLVNLATAVAKSSFKPGEDFKIIAFSFDELENADNARVAKRNYLRLLPKNFPQQSWKFLTGTRESIVALTDSMGYKFTAQKDGTFIHPSALVASAADGMIIKYVYGSFVSGDVDMAILEAERGTPASSVRRFLDYCFNYTPLKSRSFFQNVKYSVLLIFTILGAFFFMYLRRTSKKRDASNDGH
jgi:protein SCO1/2